MIKIFEEQNLNAKSFKGYLFPFSHLTSKNHSSDLTPFFKRGEVNFDCLPRRGGQGEYEKLKKQVEVSCRGRSS